MPDRGRMDQETLMMALTGYEAEKVKIEAAIANLRAQLGTSNKSGKPAKRRLSPAARRAIAAAQIRRWTQFRKAKAEAAKPKRRMSGSRRKAVQAGVRRRLAARRKAVTKSEQEAPA